MDCLYRQKYKICQISHGFQHNWYPKLSNMHTILTGGWVCDFGKVLLSNCKRISIIWIYSSTHRTTHWQPAQFRQVGRLSSNHTQIASLGIWMTRTANFAPDWFQSCPGPDGTVSNSHSHQVYMKSFQNCNYFCTWQFIEVICKKSLQSMYHPAPGNIYTLTSCNLTYILSL